MKRVDKVLNSDLFKNTLATVTAAGNKSVDDYVAEYWEIRNGYSSSGVLDVCRCINLYSHALMSYRMGKFNFTELCYIYMLLSNFVHDEVEFEMN